MDPNPTDIKLDMLRNKTSYWYNECMWKEILPLGLYI